MENVVTAEMLFKVIFCSNSSVSYVTLNTRLLTSNGASVSNETTCKIDTSIGTFQSGRNSSLMSVTLLFSQILRSDLKELH